MTTAENAGSRDVAVMMTCYMAWANRVMLDSVAKMPEEEITKPRPTLFGTIVHTFNHIVVVEDIFRAHLEGREHGYTARNTESPPPFSLVRQGLQDLDKYYVDLAERSSPTTLNETIRFQFVGGGDGAMTRLEIMLHLVNHATYHRGFISDMLYQGPYRTATNDLSVFLRDAWRR